MKELIIKTLIKKEGYTLHSAEITSDDLQNIKDSEISHAMIRWIHNGQKTNITRGPFSSLQLMTDLNMKYPATLVFLDWYCEDPEAAIASIRCSGG